MDPRYLLSQARAVREWHMSGAWLGISIVYFRNNDAKVGGCEAAKEPILQTISPSVSLSGWLLPDSNLRLIQEQGSPMLFPECISLDTYT